MGWGISILMEDDDEPRREERPERVRQEATTPRQRIVALLEERPGIAFRELTRSLGMASGTANHHLAVLERQGRVWVARERERLYFFAGDRPGEEEEVRWLLVRARMDDLDRELVEAAIEAGCQRVVLDLFEDRFPRSTVQHRLQRLVRWGILGESRSGRYLRYHAGAMA